MKDAFQRGLCGKTIIADGDLLDCEQPVCPPGPWCVFHTEKGPESKGLNLEFARALTSLLKEAPPDKPLGLQGFQFPPDFWMAMLTDRLAAGADFSRCSLPLDCEFEDLVIEGPLSFRSATFPGRLVIADTTFRGRVDLSGITVKGPTRIHTCRFDERLYCNRSRFQDAVLLRNVRVATMAVFGDCRFDDALQLEAIAVGAALDIRRAQIKREMHFLESTAEVLLLPGSLLEGPAVFGSRLPGTASSVGSGNFSHITFRKDGELVFNGIDLSGVSFSGTNLEHAQFSHVTWCDLGGRGVAARRKALNDEFTANSDHKIEAVADNYRQLVLNYESRRDYETAEEFHVGEMEMRRRKARLFRLPSLPSFIRTYLGRHPRLSRRLDLLRSLRQRLDDLCAWSNLYGLYFVASRYGTSYTRAAAVLALLTALAASGFMLLGFAPTNATEQAIEYNLLPDRDHPQAAASTILNDFGRALTFTGAIVTLQRERYFAPLNDSGKAWALVTSIVVTGQLALLGLAVRRRFKR
jgi:uncharacterized protein YjbI with pentapeptide repeats